MYPNKNSKLLRKMFRRVLSSKSKNGAPSEIRTPDLLVRRKTQIRNLGSLLEPVDLLLAERDPKPNFFPECLSIEFCRVGTT